MPSKKITARIEPGFTYHIYNRGINYQDVFFMRSDYLLFLEKLRLYLIDYADIFAFALLPNHYHLLLRVIDEPRESTFSKQYAKFILSYTNLINRRDDRTGNLFLSYFRRIQVMNEDYLRKLVFYINHNPVKHGITDDFRNYEFGSYKILVSDAQTSLKRNEVLEWFGSSEGLIDYHNHFHDLSEIKVLSFEE
jgi:putative transposase